MGTVPSISSQHNVVPADLPHPHLLCVCQSCRSPWSGGSSAKCRTKPGCSTRWRSSYFDMMEVPDSVCAVLYDEEKCKVQSDHLVLGVGDQGVLPLLSRGLRRNDVESLVVRARCKLELWDSHHGLERGEQADLVLDRQQEFRNLFIDSLA